MAVRYFGIDVGGQDASDVTISTSTTSSDIELAVDDTNLTAASVTKRQFVEIAIEALKQSVNEDAGILDNSPSLRGGASRFIGVSHGIRRRHCKPRAFHAWRNPHHITDRREQTGAGYERPLYFVARC